MRLLPKNVLYAALGLMTFFSAAIFTSCKEDKCKSTQCAYGGQCTDEGACVCLAGYEGERCETITRDKFKGVWTVTEHGTMSGVASYATTIQDGSSVDQVIIRNMYNNFNDPVTATVRGDTIFIPNQTLADSVTRTIEGKGYVIPESFYGLHGKMVMRYRIGNPDGTYNDFGYVGGTASDWTK